MSDRTNELGQPIGFEVPDWKPCSRPPRARMQGRYVQLEGNDRSRNVVARFPSLEAAVECYNSDKYQAAVGHAKLSSVRDLVVVEEG